MKEDDLPSDLIKEYPTLNGGIPVIFPKGKTNLMSNICPSNYYWYLDGKFGKPPVQTMFNGGISGNEAVDKELNKDLFSRLQEIKS